MHVEWFNGGTVIEERGCDASWSRRAKVAQLYKNIEKEELILVVCSGASIQCAT